MSKLWDENLWDTFNPHLYNFNKFNFEFLKSFIDFLKRRCKIEESYCKEMRKLCCDFRPKDYNSNSKEYVRFSVQAAFDAALGELVSMTEQRDQLLIKKLYDTRHQLQKELAELREAAAKTERRITDKNRELEASRKRLLTARSQYHRAHADMTKATAPEAQQQRRQQCATKRGTYEGALEEFNAQQKKYYQSELPEQINRLEILQRNFCTVSRNGMVECAEAETASLAEQRRCAEGMTASASRIDPEADAAAFLRVTVSGQPLPTDLHFEEPGNSSASAAQVSKSLPSGSAGAALPGLATGSDSNDGAERQKNTIAGLEKLLNAYKANPALGDASTIESELNALKTSGQLEQSASSPRQAFRDEFVTNEFDAVYSDADYSYIGEQSKPAPIETRPPASPVAQRLNRQPIPTPTESQEPAADPNETPDEYATIAPVSDRRKPTEPPAPPAADPTHPESRAPTAKAVTPDSKAAEASAAPEQVCGTPVWLLYDFKDDQQSTALSVTAGQQVRLLRTDAEWSLVARIDTSESGYVPTAYIAESPPETAGSSSS